MNKAKLDQYKYLIREKELLNKRLDNCNKEIKDIEAFFNSVDDRVIEQIIHLKFIDNQTWKAISLSLGSASESYSRNLFYRYLEKYNARQQKSI